MVTFKVTEIMKKSCFFIKEMEQLSALTIGGGFIGYQLQPIGDSLAKKESEHGR